MSNEQPLSGRTALVTGGAKRIGRACALGLAKAGARVILHYHNSEKEAENTAEDINKYSEAITVKADLSSEEKAHNLFNAAMEIWGSIDILINSASIFETDDFKTVTAGSLQKNQLIHTYAPLVLSRLFRENQPGLKKGDIINFLDTRINDYDKKHFSYHLSKQNLFSLTRILASEYAPEIKVNAVAPGLILPPPGQTEVYLTKHAGSNPLNKSGTLNDITSAVMFLINNSFITGQVLFIDGGRHMKGSFYGL